VEHDAVEQADVGVAHFDARLQLFAQGGGTAVGNPAARGGQVGHQKKQQVEADGSPHDNAQYVPKQPQLSRRNKNSTCQFFD